MQAWSDWQPSVSEDVAGEEGPISLPLWMDGAQTRILCFEENRMRSFLREEFFCRLFELFKRAWFSGAQNFLNHVRAQHSVTLELGLAKPLIGNGVFRKSIVTLVIIQHVGRFAAV